MLRVSATYSPPSFDSTTGSSRGNRTAQRTSCCGFTPEGVASGDEACGIRELGMVSFLWGILFSKHCNRLRSTAIEHNSLRNSNLLRKPGSTAQATNLARIDKPGVILICGNDQIAIVATLVRIGRIRISNMPQRCFNFYPRPFEA